MIVPNAGTAGQSPDGEKPKRILSAGRTPLSKSLKEHEQEWLLNHAVDRWGALHGALSNWRGKLQRFEKMSEGDYSDRKTQLPDPTKTDAARAIFEKQNHTLGVVPGFCDFVFGQASDDIFGTRPWMAAKPEGSSDTELARLISAHSQWKFDQTNIEESFIDAIKVAITLGMAFVKPRWIKEVETYEEAKFVAWRKSGKAALLDPAGEYVTKKEDVDARIQAGEFDGKDIEWREMLIEQTQEVFNNVACDCLDFNDVAFDSMAPELDLRYTDFFHKFQMGVLDAISFYELDEDQANALMGHVAAGGLTTPRPHRGEADTQPVNWEQEANPQITLVEGFVRCDPFRKGDPKRIQVVFIPQLRVMLSCDYLPNISPGGMLPVFPVRCFKLPRRIMAVGYWELCEDANNAIDTQYNSVSYNDRAARVPIRGYDETQFADKVTAKDFNQDPDKVHKLTPGAKLDEALQFKQLPDTNEQSIQLLNMMHQLVQMRFGITSAAQGEMKGVPSANTATGTRDLMTRGAVLVKVPVAQMTKDIRKPTEYSVHLNYANLDKEEAFVWGEGDDAELLKITPGDVQGLRAIDGAKLVTFQDELDGDNPRMIRRLDQLAMLAKKGRAMPWIGRPLTLFLPFIDTPLNIFKQAVEMSPMGTVLSVIDATRALKRKVFAGKLTQAEADAEAALIYDRARLVRDLANQTVGWAVLIALQGLVQGGGDDDPDKLPVITGTVPYKTTRRGERDNTYSVMAPMTIRIGSVQFSYSRFEPFATVMAGAADLLTEMHRTGGMKPEVLSKWLMSFKDQAKDKTFLQGVSNLLNAIEDPDRFAERLAGNTLSGFVPNIIRQPVREADTVIRDQNPRADDGFFTAVAKRVGFSVVPQLAPAKMDVWGNPVPVNRGEMVGGTRATDMAFRILDPTNAQVNPTIEPIDRWIYRFNRGTADSKDRIAIEPISNSVSATVPGEKRPRVFALSQAEQEEANRNAGRTALEVLGKDWDKTPLSSQNAQRIIDTVQMAQRMERERLKMQKLAEATK